MVALPMGSLPLGFRFHPTDEELINHYLKGKINGRRSQVEVIPEIDVCKCEPWDLPEKSVIKTGDPEWFFFAPRDRKYPNGHRSNRATEKGYWKATGKDRTIKSRSGPGGATLIGMKKTLVFYLGRAPKGERTHWIMHEYRTVDGEVEGAAGDQGAYVLCRLFRKADERSPASNCDDQDETDHSLTPTKADSGNRIYLEDQEELSGTTINEELLVQDVHEQEQWLTVKKFNEDSQKPEDSNSNISLDIGDDDDLVNALRQFCESPCDSSEPYGIQQMGSAVPYLDLQMFEEPNCQNLQLTAGFSEKNVTEFLESVLINQDEDYLEEGNDHQVSAFNVMEEEVGQTYRVNSIFSGTCSEIDTGLELQGMAGVNYHPQPISILDSGDPLQNAGVGHNDGQSCLHGARPVAQYFNPDLQTSWQELYDSLEVSNATNDPFANNDGIFGTGIAIRSAQPHNSSSMQLNQGSARRRIRLQKKIQTSISCSAANECIDTGSPYILQSSKESDNSLKDSSKEVAKSSDRDMSPPKDPCNSVNAEKTGIPREDETPLSKTMPSSSEEICDSTDYPSLAKEVSGVPEEVSSVFKAEIRSRRSNQEMEGLSRGPAHKPQNPKKSPTFVHLLAGISVVIFLIIAFVLSRHL